MWDEQLKNNLFESIETWRSWDNFNGGYTIIHRTICIESLKQRRRHSHRLTTHRKAFSFIGLFNDVGFVLLSCTHQCYHKYLTKTLSLALCLYVFVFRLGSSHHSTHFQCSSWLFPFHQTVLMRWWALFPLYHLSPSVHSSIPVVCIMHEYSKV